MVEKNISQDLYTQLDTQLEGSIHMDQLSKIMYATDASVYREIPTAVAYPKNAGDIRKIIDFASFHQLAIIPRAGGTSLAGQCVGNGIIIDVSKYLNHVIEFNPVEKTVKVEPGIIRDQLNIFLESHGLFFSPITSTANRATIGGMVGNNSSGTTSIKYGVTRDKIISLKGILSDGSEIIIHDLSKEEFEVKCNEDSTEGKIYRFFHQNLMNDHIQKLISKEFPKASIHRRNTGYAIDELLNSDIFGKTDKPFNLGKLICGSEGTLLFITEIELQLDALPPEHIAVIAAHYPTVHDSLLATQIAMKYSPYACELMDKIILDCTKNNIQQAKNRFFVIGDPEAILAIELRAESQEELQSIINNCLEDLKQNSDILAAPIIEGNDIKKIWQLRAAGLGLLANIPGAKKAVACIEDTAVSLDDLPNYIREFTAIMESYKQKAVYYAHAGAGELHLRPILDLQNEKDKSDFKNITHDVAKLVKKYQGSLSGEHGDGRVRAPFLKEMVGEEIYSLFENLKGTFDPQNIMNPGKIVHPKSMTDDLRQDIQNHVPIDTLFRFDREKGILRAAEKCNGSGDCRKLPDSGGTMCPSYHATRNEKDTTRARANTLREILSTNNQENAFDNESLKEVMDLCLSCKACASECPSNVDMATMKAEFLHQYQKVHGINLRSRVFANIDTLNRYAAVIPSFYNFLARAKSSSNLLKSILNIAPQRSLPKLSKTSLRKWYKKHHKALSKPIKTVYLFCDEFTNYQESHIGIAAYQLLSNLGYDVKIIDHQESGRAAISKGLLAKAQKHANENVRVFKEIISSETPLIGIEPSAILSFKDEYPRLVALNNKSAAEKLSENVFQIEDFIVNETKNGHISPGKFTKKSKNILFHGHCHQKSLADVENSIWMLSLPPNFTVELVNAGCCGMAGSFGYEKEHFDVSQKIGEINLYPTIREASVETIIAANGTSCRHQIADGTNRKSFHPIEILYKAMV